MEAQISETTFKTSSVSGRTMKLLLTLVPLTLICLLLHVSAGPVAIKVTQVKDKCCDGVSRTAIRKVYIKDVRMTPINCKKEAIQITTKKDKKFCLDPNWTWAQKCLSEFQKSNETI
ncbi:C-C motif chemokine 12-like [Hippoglossus hippoglossus]|uniref:C-C motif chemokine 12-like n=1 Tax=Hippoglossus hippoglossus TaxID=8267 RepID=UPI00148C84A5|nr:C-C motif chemokine 12-like [Hippoglossus hippoglossus]